MTKDYSSIWKKWILLLTVLILIPAGQLVPQAATEDSLLFFPGFDTGCTSIMVGKSATDDGSVMTCHTCDGNYRTWLNIVPGQKYTKGAVDTISWGKMHTETVTDLQGISVKGEIPQAESTFGYLNTAYPCMNEKGLAIGETTIGGRRELGNPEGLFVIEELERIVLQRCSRARDAIRLIGELVKEYGYGDIGECITIADPQEVWQLEIFGAGPLEIGSVWAAVRIPDDQVGISANIPRIAELDLDNPDFFMASENVFSVAEEMGWWNPGEGHPFKFWKAYSGRKPFSHREFFIFNYLAPQLKLDFESEELPFSIIPEKKLSVRDVMALYRQTYEGTDWDMTKDLTVLNRKGEKVKSPVATPFMPYDMLTLLRTINPDIIQYRRPVAIAACAYSHISQLRSWLPPEIGGICWFAFDNPAQSVRIPIFAGTLRLPDSFHVGSQHRFRTDSAAWAFRRANKLANSKWGEAREFIEKTLMEFEEKAFGELPDIEKKALEIQKSKDGSMEKVREYLTRYTDHFARAAVNAYWELGDKFWAMFGRRY